MQALAAQRWSFAAALAALRRYASQIAVRQERSRQLHALAELDDRMLADLGLSRDDVAREAAKGALFD